MLQMVRLFLCTRRPPEAKPLSLGKVSVSGERPPAASLKQICLNPPSPISNFVSFPTAQTCESRSCGRTRSTSKTKEVRVCGGCATPEVGIIEDIKFKTRQCDCVNDELFTAKPGLRRWQSSAADAAATATYCYQY